MATNSKRKLTAITIWAATWASDMAVQVWGNSTAPIREPQTASPRNVAIQKTPVSVGHPLVGYMAAVRSALADVSADAPHK